jgi:hypothetical protein
VSDNSATQLTWAATNDAVFGLQSRELDRVQFVQVATVASDIDGDLGFHPADSYDRSMERRTMDNPTRSVENAMPVLQMSSSELYLFRCATHDWEKWI